MVRKEGRESPPEQFCARFISRCSVGPGTRYSDTCGLGHEPPVRREIDEVNELGILFGFRLTGTEVWSREIAAYVE